MKAKWWTLEALFVSTVGVLLAAVLLGSLFGRAQFQTGSSLIPAEVLQDIRDQESRCQTYTFSEAQRGPRC